MRGNLVGCWRRIGAKVQRNRSIVGVTTNEVQGGLIGLSSRSWRLQDGGRGDLVSVVVVGKILVARGDHRQETMWWYLDYPRDVLRQNRAEW